MTLNLLFHNIQESIEIIEYISEMCENNNLLTPSVDIFNIFPGFSWQPLWICLCTAATSPKNKEER